MDPGSIGIVSGFGIILVIGIAVYIYDRCTKKLADVPNSSTPLKKMFNHV
jgi:hypothetical protein